MDGGPWGMRTEWGETSDCPRLLPGESVMVIEQKGKPGIVQQRVEERAECLGTPRLLKVIRQSIDKKESHRKKTP